MKKIIKYKIIKNNSIEELGSLITRYIEANWQPLGGPFLYNGATFCQALVLYES